jgi:hypothetical protein
MEGDNVLATQDDHPTIAPEDTEAQAAALSIDVPEDTGEGGKLRMIVQLVKRSFGVKDLAAMCAPNHLSDPTNVHSFSLFPGVFHSLRHCWSQYPTSNTGITSTDPISLQRSYASFFNLLVLSGGQD